MDAIFLDIPAGVASVPLVGQQTVTPAPSPQPAAPSTPEPVVTQASRSNRINHIGVSPGGSTEADGRLNPYTYLGYPVFYCVNASGYTDTGSYSGGGIVIYHYAGAQQGVVFFVSEAQINAVGVPAQKQLIHAETGYDLYRRPDGLFEMRGLNIHGEAFRFLWNGCTPGPVLGVE
jgi:hypothetical protein